MTDLLAARMDFGAFLAGTTKGLVADGKLKALAIVQDKRSELMPDVPTTAEQGLPGFTAAGVHFMMFAPAATPKPLVARLGAELHKVISDPALKQRFVGIGFDATPMTAEEVSTAMRRTEAALVPVVKRLNIKLD
jgi:tripartite-type tricarboxylate transporter receptor subunit TctC